jgi:catechol-2,3-dioxygenase
MLEFGGIARVAQAGFETTNLDALADYYRETLGFTETLRDGGASYLTTGEDHHTVVLREGANDALTHIAFQLGDGVSIADARSALAESGVEAELRTDAEPGLPEFIEFSDPEGNTLRLFSEVEESNGGATANGGVRPRKFGHICVRAADVPAVCGWYETVLGFRWSDWIGDFFVFVRCGSDHHVLNLLKGGQAGNVLHHIAYELEDWDRIRPACDLLSKRGYPLVWGPGRHGPGHNVYTYHRDPDGHLVELFTDLDVMDEEAGRFEPRPWHEDDPQRPKRWTPDPLAPNRWGIGPPDGFM